MWDYVKEEEYVSGYSMFHVKYQGKLKKNYYATDWTLSKELKYLRSFCKSRNSNSEE